MPVVISMLRGVNVGRHNRIKMDALRALYESLKLREARTYVQSGNVIFRSERHPAEAPPAGGRERSRRAGLAKGGDLAAHIEDAIEHRWGFRPTVILRTASELRDVIARNPFAARHAIDPSRLLVLFLAREPGPEARNQLLRIRTDPEELRVSGRELYIYYPDGMARPKLSWTVIEKTLKTPATGRNWNSVLKLLEIAEGMESAAADSRPFTKQPA